MTEAVAISPILSSAQIVGRIGGISTTDLAGDKNNNQPMNQPTGPALVLASTMPEAQQLLGIRPRQSPFTY